MTHPAEGLAATSSDASIEIARAAAVRSPQSRRPLAPAPEDKVNQAQVREAKPYAADLLAIRRGAPTSSHAE